MNHESTPLPSLPLTADHCVTRVLIVGAGPIGMELAVALKRRAIPFEIVDAGTIGQTIRWWAPQTRWFSSNERIAIAGVPLLTIDQSKATREDYLTYLRGIASQFDIRVRSFEPVVDIKHRDAGFTVKTTPTSGANTIDCQAIVLASGGTDFPRRLQVPGEDLPHVDGYLREPHRYFGRRVLILGGRNSAVEAALRLHHAGAQVSLSYRGPELPADGIKYWLLPEIRGLCEAGRITAYLGTRAIEITQQQVTLQSTTNHDTIEVPADDVLSLIGYEQSKTLFERAGVERLDTSQRPRFDSATMETNVAGIYVAGTAVAGTQNSRYKIFLENCHEHIDKIVAHLSGETAQVAPARFEQQITAQPES